MKKIFITILFLICLVPSMSFAAELSFIAEKNTFAQSEDFLVQVFLDTKSDSVNAVEGTVTFPASLLEIKEVRDGNSAINFWVEKPHEVNSGRISYSGITTGGFSGDQRFLFSVIFHTKKLGSGQISFEQTKVLKNDGSGTQIATQTKPFTFSVSKDKNATQKDLSIKDTNPPEDFTPFISKDSNIFNGKNFLVFSTVDKGSGVDHYEVRESFMFGLDGAYVKAESPYELRDQSLLKSVYVKAVDKNGNQRIVKLSPKNHFAWLLLCVIFAIILGAGIFIGKKIKKLWSKFTK